MFGSHILGHRLSPPCFGSLAPARTPRQKEFWAGSMAGANCHLSRVWVGRLTQYNIVQCQCTISMCRSINLFTSLPLFTSNVSVKIIGIVNLSAIIIICFAFITDTIQYRPNYLILQVDRYFIIVHPNISKISKSQVEN